MSGLNCCGLGMCMGGEVKLTVGVTMKYGSETKIEGNVIFKSLVLTSQAATRALAQS